MIVLAGATVVLPDRVLPNASLILDGDRIAAIAPGAIDGPAGATRIPCTNQTIVPGLVDVHVHGVEGVDVLDGPGAVANVARRLPRYGTTSFCPTSIACDPATLSELLTQVRDASARPADGAEAPPLRARQTTPGAARVVAAHLESNFINPEYKGAQPASCLRVARFTREAEARRAQTSADFAPDDIRDLIAAHRRDVGIVTIAPEIDGGLDLVHELSVAGHRVSIGHTGASYDEAMASIEAGVTHATHLFNRMTPMTHRAPGVPGAVLQSEAVAAELICDGFHVHPALLRVAINAKGVSRIMAITDGTAGSGLPVGSRTRLGGRPIVVTARTAELEDGTLAGSLLTMDGAFRQLLSLGCSLVEASRMCATTPATELGLAQTGQITEGFMGDLVVLDEQFRVVRTFVGGVETPPSR